MHMLRGILAAVCVARGAGFVQRPSAPRVGVARHAAPAREPFECEVDLEAGEPVKIQITPTMSDSELVVAQYPRRSSSTSRIGRSWEPS